METLVAQHFTITAFVSIALGYLLGSIPFGLVITKLAGLGDIRNIGSGNIGATNVLRTGRKDLAALTLILDGGKGAAAVLIASHFGLQAMMGAAMGSFLGHLYPVWLRFKGGKGVATTLGILLAFAPWAGVATCATWLVTAFVTRISSLSALVALALAPFYTAYFYTPKWSWLIGTIAIISWWKHRENIKRLLKGEEPKIGKKKDAGAS
ncbi:MAG: glycerol-3-phosphate 1-O-acyltransferase PlsY [Alphaproteobacteria bacterium]|nr:glycerol-3-phosphate 1-O-acyltransferase PlsY [Alphaproteobacteria bacterium]